MHALKEVVQKLPVWVSQHTDMEKLTFPHSIHPFGNMAY